MTINRANNIYNILVNKGGASESDRSNFIYHHTKNKCDEWRFSGKLGFGGKYRSNQNSVDCYSEDETTERLILIEEINELLSTV